MSYLDLPRFHILGTFFTDPSTINNDPSHYDPDCTEPSPWQDPNGTHSFRLVKVSVTAALDANGQLVSNSAFNTDPLIGAPVSSVDQPSPARLVDLDVYQQGVSTIWAFQLQITLGDQTLIGSLDVCSLNSMRFSRVLPTRGWAAWDEYGWGSFGGDTNAVGYFQSVLRVAPQNWPTNSPLLDQLRLKTITDANGNILISIRLVMDGYQNVPQHDDFRTGRILGTLGPVLSTEEPVQAPGSRWLNPRPLQQKPKAPSPPWYWPDFYGAPFRFAQRDGGVQTIVIDLANALATQTPGGSMVDLGNLVVKIGKGKTGSIGPFQINDNLYSNLGGIIEMPVTNDQFNARHQPVSVITSRDDIGGPALWAEATSGFYFAADNRALRLTSEPGSAQRQIQSRIYVTQWGEPVVNSKALKVEVVSVVNGNQAATVPWSAGYKGNTPKAKGAVKATISATDANGWATVTMTAVKDPGSRTEQLDSQLYFIVPYPAKSKPPNLMKVAPPQEQMISVVAWSSYKINKSPSWKEVQRMMAPYSKLYPAMKVNIDLANQHAFQIFATNPPWSRSYPGSQAYTLPDGKQLDSGAIGYYLTLDINHPSYMPITRDLSPNKVMTILYYAYKLTQQFPSTGPPPSSPPPTTA